MRFKRLIPYILLVIAFVTLLATNKAMLDGERATADTKAQTQQEVIRDLTAALEEQGKEIEELSKTILTLQSKIEKLEAWEIDPELPLPPHLQIQTQSACKVYGLPLGTVYDIMNHESRMIPDVPDNYNRNGTRDRGLMQINEVNWPWLADLGLDVSEPSENIAAGCYLLAFHTQKYGLQDGLRAYAAGETGMKNGGGYWFLEELAEQNIEMRKLI